MSGTKKGQAGMEVSENQAVAVQARNRFDRMEIAGAFGDLGAGAVCGRLVRRLKDGRIRRAAGVWLSHGHLWLRRRYGGRGDSDHASRSSSHSA